MGRKNGYIAQLKKSAKKKSNKKRKNSISYKKKKRRMGIHRPGRDFVAHGKKSIRIQNAYIL
jgi:hypothetical protein